MSYMIEEINEMIKKAKETKVISDPGYKYYLEMQKVNIKKSR